GFHDRVGGRRACAADPRRRARIRREFRETSERDRAFSIRGALPLGLPHTLSRPSTSLGTTLSLPKGRSPLRGSTGAHHALSEVEGRRLAPFAWLARGARSRVA